MKIDNIDLEMAKMLKDEKELFEKKLNLQASFFATVSCLKKESKENIFNSIKKMFNTENKSLYESTDRWQHLLKGINAVKNEELPN